jgi:hypothetical protein
MSDPDNTNPEVPSQASADNKWSLKKVIVITAVSLVALAATVDIASGVINGTGVNFEHINSLLDKLISLLQNSGDS